MATSVRLLKRYVWLIDTIRRAGSITLEEISQKWQDDYSLRLEAEKELPPRTFHRHRIAIEDIFGIKIVCNRYGENTYYIANEEDLQRPTFTSRLFNCLSLANQVAERKEVAGRILYEDIPGGMEYMPMIIQALAEQRKLRLSYSSISHGEYKDVSVEPYFIKERMRRWYVIGRVEGHAAPEVLAFDRIVDLSQLDECFEYPSDIDPTSYFDEVIGILLDDEYDCERVVLRLYGRQAKYVALLPLHKSQKEIMRGKEYTDFEYRVRPEWEFVHEVLRLGSDVEVLSPQWLREEIKWQAEQIVKRYD